VGSCDLLLISATPYISQEQLKLESPARAVRAVHSMWPLPNYFGLLLCYSPSETGRFLACSFLILTFIVNSLNRSYFVRNCRI